MNKYLEILLNTPPRVLFRLVKPGLRKNEPYGTYDSINPCVFVLSTGRVGTKTLAELFTLDNHVFAYHEPLPKFFGLSRMCYDQSDGASVGQNVEAALVEAFLTGRRDLLNCSLYNNRGYIETSPQVTFVAPFILKVIPDARFIHVVRNPQEVVASGVRRKWYTGQINDQWRITPRPGDPFEPIWGKLDQVEKILWLWAETNRWILDFSATQGKGHCQMIHSEDLFSGNADTIRSLYDHPGLAMPAERKIRHILRKPINAQKSGEFEKTGDWYQRVNPELAHFVTQIAVSLGYKFP
ncbi:MAG: sulfotransferase [Anaerolineaceae bacterium]|nr:sulfotransferase [Anaerolineaceae bacterium]